MLLTEKRRAALVFLKKITRFPKRYYVEASDMLLLGLAKV